MDLPPQLPAIGGAQDHETGASVGSRVLTGLALAAMGGLLMLASGGYAWAVNLVRGSWPLFILAVGFSTVMIVTDRDDVVGKLSVVAGLVILFAARFGILPEATVRALGPWAFILAGLAIALSGVQLHVWPVGQGERRPSAGLSRDELLEIGGRRGKVPVAGASARTGVSARTGGIHDAEVAAGPVRRLREAGAACSHCRANVASRGYPDRPRSRTETLPGHERP